MTTANKLTILRIICVIPFISMMTFVLLSKENISYVNLNTSSILFISSFALFLFAMFLDFLDGYIARKTKTITVFGKLFDPLADKFITTTAFLFLSILNIIPVYLIIIMILRDILVNGFRNIAAKNNVNISSNMWGKSKTFVQSLAIILAFALAPFIVQNSSIKIFLFNIPTIIALALSIISGIIYFLNIKHLIKLK